MRHVGVGEGGHVGKLAVEARTLELRTEMAVVENAVLPRLREVWGGISL